MYLIFTFREFKSIHKGKTAILHLRFGTEKNRRLGSKKARYNRAFRKRHLFCLHIMAETEGFEPSSLKGHHDFESSCQNRTWWNLTEDNGRCENPENAVFSRLSAPLCIENAVKIRVRESPPISPSSNGFSGKPIRIFDRTDRFFAPKSRFWQCVKSTGYAGQHPKSCRLIRFKK